MGRGVFLDDVRVFEDVLGADDALVILCAGHVLLVVDLDPEIMSISYHRIIIQGWAKFPCIGEFSSCC